MDGNLAMLNYQQYESEAEFNEALEDHINYRRNMLLVHIIKQNQFINVVCLDVKSLVKEVFYSTGVLLKSERVIDHYEANDDWYDVRKRINNREFYLTIREEI